MRRDPETAHVPVSLTPLGLPPIGGDANAKGLRPLRWPQPERRVLFWIAVATLAVGAYAYLDAPKTTREAWQSHLDQLVSFHDEVGLSRLWNDPAAGREVTPEERAALLKRCLRSFEPTLGGEGRLDLVSRMFACP
jgi:hypothetical protein